MTKEDKQLIEKASEHICSDFETYCNYIIENKVTVPASTCQINKKDCYNLNQEMFFQETYEEAAFSMPHYAIIHFFHYFSGRNKILSLKNHTKTKVKIGKGKKYDVFFSLSRKGQYLLFFLNFVYEYASALKKDFAYSGGGIFQMMEAFGSSYGDTYIQNTQQMRRIFFEELHEYSYILRVLHEMGLCELTLYSAEEEKKLIGHIDDISTVFSTKVKAVKVSEAGVAAGKWLTECNEVMAYEVEKDMLVPWMLVYAASGIYVKEFVPEEWFLIKDIAGEGIEEKEEIFDLKVKLGYSTRTIRMNGSDTLDDLHFYIQAAFEFDADHLYYFTVGFGMVEMKYYCPYVEDELYLTDETQLGQLELEQGDRFSYLFDFGDEWEFDIFVEDVQVGHVDEPSVIHAVGAAPSQYGGSE